MLKYDLGNDEKAAWLLTEDGFNERCQGKCESIMSQGNGYLGLRAAFEEAYIGRKPGLFVAGTFNCFAESETTELPNMADPLPIELDLNGTRFSMNAGDLETYRRVLDLQTGELTRSLIWQSPQGARYSISCKRFVSMDNRHIIGQKLCVTALDNDTRIVWNAGINGTVCNGGTQHFIEGESRVYDKRILRYTAVTTQSSVLCCLHSTVSTNMEAPLLPIIDRRRISLRAELLLPVGETLTIEKITVVTTSRDCDDHADAAERGLTLAQCAVHEGYDALLERSADTWKTLWHTQDIQIDSEQEKDLLAMRFAIYHLNVLSPKDDPRIGLAAKGLSGEGYKGHAFWDTEIFMLPYFVLSQPEIARNLLEYRYLGLDGARRKARENGYSGAMFPWEAAWSSDGETTPLWGSADVVTGKRMKILTGLIEQHITADIAFAIWQYYTATGDDQFMKDFGWEMLVETAIFWSSRVTWDEQKHAYVINDVIGPDEYKEHVNNNAYTNYMAANNMKLGLKAVEAIEAIGGTLLARLSRFMNLKDSASAIQETLDGLYLPIPDENGIIPQFDGYTNLTHIDLSRYKQAAEVGTIYNDYNIDQISAIQVSKQADTVELLLLMDDLFSHDVKRKNFAYYEDRTLHDSSLSKAAHSVLAADMGDLDMAYRFFQSACDVDMGPDMTTSSDGIHAAAMGGLWQCAVYGFLGLRIVGNTLRISPNLPKEWRCISVMIHWHDSKLVILANKNGTHINRIDGEPVTLSVNGDQVTV